MTIVLALQITGWIEGSWKKAGDEIYIFNSKKNREKEVRNTRNHWQIKD